MNKIRNEFDSAKRKWIRENITNDDLADAIKLFDKSPLTVESYFREHSTRTNTGIMKFLEKRAEKNSKPSSKNTN